jgi:CheY-like chemotaxis protein
VVDDNPVNLQVLVRTLDGQAHRILAAMDGRAALDIARRVRPDLMLLDVMMPGLDGFEVCRSIKADAATSETIVIFLSALGEVPADDLESDGDRHAQGDGHSDAGRDPPERVPPALRDQEGGDDADDERCLESLPEPDDERG